MIKLSNDVIDIQNYFQLTAAILSFRCRTKSMRISVESVETGDPENIGISFGISILPVLELELQPLPV